MFDRPSKALRPCKHPTTDDLGQEFADPAIFMALPHAMTAIGFNAPSALCQTD